MAIALADAGVCHIAAWAMLLGGVKLLSGVFSLVQKNQIPINKRIGMKPNKDSNKFKLYRIICAILGIFESIVLILLFIICKNDKHFNFYVVMFTMLPYSIFYFLCVAYKGKLPRIKIEFIEDKDSIDK